MTRIHLPITNPKCQRGRTLSRLYLWRSILEHSPSLTLRVSVLWLRHDQTDSVTSAPKNTHDVTHQNH